MIHCFNIRKFSSTEFSEKKIESATLINSIFGEQSSGRSRVLGKTCKIHAKLHNYNYMIEREGGGEERGVVGDLA